MQAAIQSARASAAADSPIVQPSQSRLWHRSCLSPVVDETSVGTTSTAKGRVADFKLLGLLTLVCVPLIVAGLALSETVDATPPGITLGNVSEAHMVEIRNQGGEVVLAGEFRSRVDQLGNTEKDAALIDRRGRTVIGEIELEIPAANRTHRRPELEVDILGLPPRETFTVVIDDRVVGTFVTDDRGGVDMELQEGEAPPGPLGIQPPASNATASSWAAARSRPAASRRRARGRPRRTRRARPHAPAPASAPR